MWVTGAIAGIRIRREAPRSMGFSVKLAPGVRVGVSSHGVRAGIGPRIARVHVGTGRTGFSSGLGPFSVYGAVGGKGRRKSSHTSGGRGSGRPSGAALERQAAAARRTQAEADKAREAQRLAAIFQEIISLHRHDFPPVERLVAPMPQLPDPNAVREWHEKNALRGVSMFDWARRAAARQYAAQAAQAELNNRARRGPVGQRGAPGAGGGAGPGGRPGHRQVRGPAEPGLSTGTRCAACSTPAPR
jgi:hypothetical protein